MELLKLHRIGRAQLMLRVQERSQSLALKVGAAVELMMSRRQLIGEVLTFLREKNGAVSTIRPSSNTNKV